MKYSMYPSIEDWLSKNINISNFSRPILGIDIVIWTRWHKRFSDSFHSS